ncbi:MAG: fasciclin domain-containing protein [Isosphaeraceae bacterium]
MNKFSWASALVVVLTSAISVQAADKDIVETAKAAGNFNTLLTAATKAGLVDTLKSDGPFTLFAPTDEAFAKVPKATLDALLQDKAKLKEVLLYHVVPGNVMAADALKVDSARTAQGQPIRIKAEGGKVMINNAQVIQPDIKTSNGVIHVINAVLLPPAK